MLDFGALTMVGLIATVLSIGFALAAFINSRRRDVHKQEQPEADAQALPFPAPAEPPRGSNRPAQPAFYSTASRHVTGVDQAKPAFKQVQALGAPSAQNDPSSSDEYLWE
ncbi:MAG: hypothetical protein PHW60_14575 [Kiritimatiellae bacterium]|nr:hypothetical protein [Kiritimatiellia bacterium]